MATEKTPDQLLKEKLKGELDQLILYINAEDSALKQWHQEKYQKTVKEFNRLLARDAK